MSDVDESVLREATRRGPLAELGEVWRYRGFIAHLLARDLKTQYNRSIFGWLWAFINPLTTLLIYSVVFGTILGGDEGVGVGANDLRSFTHFLVSGLVVWNLFATVSTDTMHAFGSSLHLRHRMYFPPAAPMFAKALSVLVTTSIELIVVIVAYVAVGVVGLSFLGLLPVLLLVAVLGVGVGLLLAVANIRYRDVGYLYGVFLRLFFFLTPLIYSLDIVAGKDLWGIDLETALRLNPLTHFADAARHATYLLEWPSLKLWSILSSTSAVMFVAGWVVFARSAPDASEGA